LSDGGSTSIERDGALDDKGESVIMGVLLKGLWTTMGDGYGNMGGSLMIVL